MNKYNIRRKKSGRLWFVCIALLILSISTLIFPVNVIAEGSPPVLVSPESGATNVEITGLTFSWQAPDTFAQGYVFELSSSDNFSNPIVSQQLYDITYTYTGTLEQGKTYYWRVQVQEPAPSDWGQASFTTKGSDTTGSSNNSSSDNATGGAGTTAQGGSFIDNIISFLSEIGWPLVGGMAFVLIVLIVLISMLLSKPKKKTPPRMSGAQMGGGTPPGTGAAPGTGMGQQIPCTTCGTVNLAGKKFCANCGSSLAVVGQQFQQRPPQFSQGGSVCSSCGSPVPPGRQFCGVCGGKVAPPQQPGWQSTQFRPPSNCTVCGSPLQPGQQFCGSCGNSISSGQQQTTTTYQSEMFMCPICGASINKGTNPCPSCNTWLDWGM